ncbi:MAG: hypothetical protein MRY76_06485 [Pseudomonadales bacterium]|nr:hypothetical protein [Pseudomonadales bacterium]
MKQLQLLWQGLLAGALMLLCSLAIAGQEATEPDPDAAQQGSAGQEEQQEEQLSAEERARIEALSLELTEVQRRLQDLQSELGVYSPVLGETYSDLGALYTELEDYDNASRVYNEAWQLARINTGLYSEAQIPLLHSLIDSHQRQRDWRQVDDLAHLLLHMQQRLHGRNSATYLAEAEDYGKWKLRVINENLLDLGSRARLNEARNLSVFYEQLLIDVQQNPAAFALDESDNRDKTVLALLEGKTEADLTMARSVAMTPASYFTGTAPRYVTQTRCQTVINQQGQQVRNCYNVQVENPRYRQSQSDAKRFELSRYVREINQALDQMQAIRNSNDSLSADEIERLDMRIGELRTASREIRSNSRSLMRF